MLRVGLLDGYWIDPVASVVGSLAVQWQEKTHLGIQMQVPNWHMLRILLSSTYSYIEIQLNTVIISRLSTPGE